MNNNFYIEDSDEFYFGEFWTENRKALQKEGAVMLTREDANQLKIDTLLQKYDGDEKPNLNNSYDFFAIPYELDDEISFKENRLIDSVINLVNKNLQSDKFFASTDRDKCCVIRTAIFNEAIIWEVASGHLNTPFIIFDEKKEFFLLLDYDLPIQIVGYKKENISLKEIEEWKEFFKKEWPTVLKKYTNYKNLQKLVEQYYSFIEMPQT